MRRELPREGGPGRSLAGCSPSPGVMSRRLGRARGVYCPSGGRICWPVGGGGGGGGGRKRLGRLEEHADEGGGPIPRLGGARLAADRVDVHLLPALDADQQARSSVLTVPRE